MLFLCGSFLPQALTLSIYGRFGTSEKQWVEAQVENAKQQAILMALKSQVASDEAHIHMDLHSLR